MTFIEKIHANIDMFCANQSLLKNYRKILYGVLLLDVVVSLPVFSYVLPVQGLTPIEDYPFWGFFTRPFHVLHEPPFASFYIYFLAGYTLALCLGFFNYSSRLVAIFIFYFFKTLCLKTIELNNGGHDLMGLLLFYNIFHGFGTSHIEKTTHFLSIWAARLQVCSMYFFAFYYKTFGQEWFYGNALSLALSNPYYSVERIIPYALENGWLFQVANYAGLFYPIAFLVLIWFQKTRNILLLFGILFHLSIWALLGLYDFAWFVMASYALFWKYSKPTLTST